jgi:hypothetical protein
MHRNKKAWIIVVILVIVIKVFAVFPVAVERYYSNGLYSGISKLQRFLFGWIPFSVGDLLYGAAVLYLLVKLVRFAKAVIKRKMGKDFWLNSITWLFFWSLGVYVVFNILWGLNYNRLGTAYQLQLQMKPYSNEELKAVMQVIVRRLDETADAALPVRDTFLQKRPLFEEAARAYRQIDEQYPTFSYRPASVKPSLFSYLGDYLGYTGYYNPFSGEAQVNTTVPVFVRPFTTCHEIGHQLGYAKENEANFAGYLSAKSSEDVAFRYSVYFDLYVYGRNELRMRDSAAAKEIHRQASKQVKKDLVELAAFYDRYENPIEPVIRKLYGQYLRANQQPSGMQTYSEVMAFLVAYYKKYGESAL